MLIHLCKIYDFNQAIRNLSQKYWCNHIVLDTPYTYSLTIKTLILTEADDNFDLFFFFLNFR